MANILIIDNTQSGRNYLKDLLTDEGHKVASTADADQVYNTANGKLDLILCNTNASARKGLDIIDRMREAGIKTPVVMLSDHCESSVIVEAIKKGVEDFIVRPYDMNKLMTAIKSGISNTQGKPDITKKQPSRTSQILTGLDHIIGDSEAINKVKQMITRIAASDSRVFITGDNGTGKELVARAIHNNSPRNKFPFVDVNCAAIPSELIESELFGHEKGSFTSAVRDRKGKFEQAEGGTLFMDEVGDMSLSAQSKVLRALQEKKVCRIGSDKDINVDVRVIAATNKNIEEEISKGNFREDLYHRLSVILSHVPPLSERIEDIPLIINHFLHSICEEYSVAKKSVADEAIEMLKHLEWRGNVRQLRNVMERLIILGGDIITPDDVRSYVH